MATTLITAASATPEQMFWYDESARLDPQDHIYVRGDTLRDIRLREILFEGSADRVEAKIGFYSVEFYQYDLRKQQELVGMEA